MIASLIPRGGKSWKGKCRPISAGSGRSCIGMGTQSHEGGDCSCCCCSSDDDAAGRAAGRRVCAVGGTTGAVGGTTVEATVSWIGGMVDIAASSVGGGIGIPWT